MPSLSPVAIALFITLAVVVTGIVVTLLRRSNVLKGYSEYAADITRLGSLMKGEIFRDGDDVVVSGNYGKLPAVIRFSYRENTPGLNIRVQVPSTFTLAVAPRAAAATEGRVAIATGEPNLDARFTTRSDHPQQARMFLGGRQALVYLQKLMCSQQTFLTLTTGTVELSELSIPSPYTSRHVSEHLDSIVTLGRLLEAMPGSEAIRIQQVKRERSSWVLRVAIAIGILAAVSVVLAASDRSRQQVAAAEVQIESEEVIRPVDAQVITNAAAMRVIRPDDLASSFSAWARRSGVEASGRLAADFSGQANGFDVAYVLARGPGKKRRVVLIANKQNRYDADFEELSGAAPVPRQQLASVEWVGGKPPFEATGDGLLLVRNFDDAASGIIVYLSGDRVVTAVPANFQQVNLR